MVIVIGSMISLAYYLRVVAAMWMRPAGGRRGRAVDGCARAWRAPTRWRSGPTWEVTLVAVLAGAAIVVFGVIPSPLLNLAGDAGRALGLL